MGLDTLENQLLYIPEAGTDHLGRNLIIHLGLEIKNCDQLLITGPEVTNMALLTEEQEKRINLIVWSKEGNSGGLNITPLKIKLERVK